MASPQSYADRLEHIMCDVFNCERFGIGGLVNSDYIRRHPFTAMVSTLTFLSGSRNADNIEGVSKFFEDFSYYSGWSIDDFLNFDSNSKTFANGNIEYDNGEEAMKDIISAFSETCKALK